MEETTGILIQNSASDTLAIKIFEEDIADAFVLLESKKKLIKEIITEKAEQKTEILAIVFPEIIRWNAFQDVIEFSANKVLYVNGGAEASDFSVGEFQMRPSFVEDLEKYVLANSQFEKWKYIVIQEQTETKSRAIRIERMSLFEWQLRYAYLYWLIANDKFKNIRFKNHESKVRFFATAYNFGFTKSINKIKIRQHKANFPYGVNYKGHQVAYSDISVFFLKKYANQFHN